jgi:GNAT superfamily N-acetyltransferase
VSDFLVRCAIISEQKELEALQLRASLTNAGDRDALLAHPDAIELPIDQIAAGVVFVSERNGVIVGFAALLPRPDGDVELDALFVDPDVRRRGVEDRWSTTVSKSSAHKDLRRFALSAIPTPTTFTGRVVLMLLARWRLVSARDY